MSKADLKEMESVLREYKPLLDKATLIAIKLESMKDRPQELVQELNYCTFRAQIINKVIEVSEHKDLLCARYIHGMTMKQIANQQNVSERTCRRWIVKDLKRAHKLLNRSYTGNIAVLPTKE